MDLVIEVELEVELIELHSKLTAGNDPICVLSALEKGRGWERFHIKYGNPSFRLVMCKWQSTTEAQCT